MWKKRQETKKLTLRPKESVLEIFFSFFFIVQFKLETFLHFSLWLVMWVLRKLHYCDCWKVYPPMVGDSRISDSFFVTNLWNFTQLFLYPTRQCSPSFSGSLFRDWEISKFPCTVHLTCLTRKKQLNNSKMSKFSCYCSFYVPDNCAHSQEVVIDGAPALLVAVGSKPTDEQHH